MRNFSVNPARQLSRTSTARAVVLPHLPRQRELRSGAADRGEPVANSKQLTLNSDTLLPLA